MLDSDSSYGGRSTSWKGRRESDCFAKDDDALALCRRRNVEVVQEGGNVNL